MALALCCDVLFVHAGNGNCQSTYCRGASATQGGVCRDRAEDDEECDNNDDCINGDCQFTNYNTRRRCKPLAGFALDKQCWGAAPQYGTHVLGHCFPPHSHTQHDT